MEIYRRPANLFVAEFVGNPTINLVSLDDPATADLGRAILDRVRAHDSEAADAVRTVGLRPEAVRLVPAGDDAWWTASARIETILPTGPEWIVRLRAGGATVSMLASQEPPVRPGDEVPITAARSDLHLFDAAGARIGATVGAGQDARVLV
jgi:ABC-type sugar transport system ATPase subunit